MRKTPLENSARSVFPENGSSSTPYNLVLICAAIFLIALGVRLLHWQDNRQSFPFIGMTGEYKAHALVLVAGNLDGFLRGPDPPGDANVVKHPPGYPLFMAAVYKVSGNSDTALRSVHIALDALAALLIFFIAAELFPLAAASLAGLLVALSPQLAYHSIMLLPDPLATPPLLVAVYLLIRAVKRPRYITIIAAGAFVAASCWLRSNAMLLPFFLAALSPFLFKRGERLRYAATLVATAIVLFAPVTIRNYLAFRSFIPLSLSAGITLVEGIGVYDTAGRFGLPATDIGVTQWEARLYGRPDYLCGRFAPDGVERERRRVARGLRVIRERPLWFAGVMAHRASTMLRLTRVEHVAAWPAATRPLEVKAGMRAAWSLSPVELQAGASPALGETSATLSLVGIGDSTRAFASAPVDCGRYKMPIQYAASRWYSPDEAGGERQQALRFAGEAAKEMFSSPPVAVRRNTDYLLRIPLRIRQGSVTVGVVDARDGTRLTSTPILHPVNWAELHPDEQPFITVEQPFVSGEVEEVRVVVENGHRKPTGVTADVGGIEAFDLGPSSYLWTRYPRVVVRSMQRLFLTAVMLPLLLFGAASLLFERRAWALVLLLVIPVYYMSVQSALWTEFRYVLAMYYFLLLLSAVGLHWACVQLWQVARRTVTFATTRRVTRATL